MVKSGKCLLEAIQNATPAGVVWERVQNGDPREMSLVLYVRDTTVRGCCVGTPLAANRHIDLQNEIHRQTKIVV